MKRSTPWTTAVRVEHAAGAGAGSHRDAPLRLGHLQPDPLENREHLHRDPAGDDHQVALAGENRITSARSGRGRTGWRRCAISSMPQQAVAKGIGHRLFDRFVTGRLNIIAFTGSFHGRTLLATALTTAKSHYRQGYEHSAFRYLSCSVPILFAMPSWANPGKCNLKLADTFEAMFTHQLKPDTVGAILIEPVME